MCTSLSHHPSFDTTGWYSGDGGDCETGDETASLQRLVQDLHSQLTRCHKVIRGLQLRVRSLSTTSDYASSLERTPRKVAPSQSRASNVFWKCSAFVSCSSFRLTGRLRNLRPPAVRKRMRAGCLTPREFALVPGPVGSCKSLWNESLPLRLS